MNHTLPAGDDVTEGYVRPSIEHLRGAVEQMAAFLLRKMRQADEPGMRRQLGMLEGHNRRAFTAGLVYVSAIAGGQART